MNKTVIEKITNKINNSISCWLYNKAPNTPNGTKIISMNTQNYAFVGSSDCINWNLKIKEICVQGNIVTSKKAKALYQLHHGAILDTLEYSSKIKEIMDLKVETWTIEEFRMKTQEIRETLYNKRQ